MVVLFSSNLYAIDVEKSEFVSSGEIVEALRNVYEKYDGSFILHSVNNDIHYTKAELMEEICKLETSLKATKSELVVEPIIEGSGNGFDIVPQGFHYTREYTSYINASNGVSGNATIEISCTGTIYDGTITFVSVSNISTRRYGTATGFISWAQTSSDYTISEDKKFANVNATGTLVTRLNVLGVEYSAAYDHVIGMLIHAR